MSNSRKFSKYNGIIVQFELPKLQNYGAKSYRAAWSSSSKKKVILSLSLKLKSLPNTVPCSFHLYDKSLFLSMKIINIIKIVRLTP